VIRFVDVRYQGLQARFAFWDTVTNRFLAYNEEVAFDGWDDFAEAFGLTVHAQNQPLLTRLRSLCPPWVFESPTEEELDFRKPRFIAEVTRSPGDHLRLAGPESGYEVFNSAEARDAFVAEFPEGRRAVEP